MPWLETVPMEERLRFVHDAFSDRFTMSELCARYGVSRRIGYKWLERFEAEGRPGLKDRSRAPHHCPHRIAPAVANVLVAARRAHPHWGARKLPRSSSAPDIPRSRSGPRRVPWPISWRAAASCSIDGDAGTPCIPARRRPSPLRRTISGPRTSRASSAPAIAATAIRYGRRSPFELSSTVGACSDQDRDRASRLRAGLSRVRPTARHPYRQRRPFATQAIHGLCISTSGGCARHRAPADPPGLSARERGARAHASHPQTAGHQTGATDLRRAAAQFRRLPPRVQPRASARTSGTATPSSCYQESSRAYPDRLPPLSIPDTSS